jgi:hyaluronoglucosaminidase
MSFKTGLIEGFYGLEWDFSTRLNTVDFLKSIQADFYIYAPKADKKLREDWIQNWSTEQTQSIKKLAQKCAQESISFGVGLSPFELYHKWNSESKKALKDKIEELNECGVDFLSILFDDMQGDRSQMAHIQADIAHFACEHSKATHFAMCPTYYSDDPVLVSLFGAMPPQYLEDLGKALDPKIDIFWTGPTVCSANYPRQHLQNINKILGRKPLIWDNYPVNDGVRMAPFLHLSPFSGREYVQEFCSGIGINPMVEPYLSRISMATLAHNLAGDSLSQEELIGLLSKMMSVELASQIVSDIPTFHKRGIGLGSNPEASLRWARRILNASGFTALEDSQKQQIRDYQNRFEAQLTTALSDKEKSKYTQIYSQFTASQDAPFAQEILEWLSGRYEFDPTPFGHF